MTESNRPNAIAFRANQHALSDDALAQQAANRRSHWLRLKRMTVVLLLLWVAVTFGSTYFARELNVVVLGWPFSYWMAAQGVLLIYLLIIGVYAYAANQLDKAFDVAESQSQEVGLE